MPLCGSLWAATSAKGRGIHFMLDAFPDAIHRAELEEQIDTRGLQGTWPQVQDGSESLAP